MSDVDLDAIWNTIDKLLAAQRPEPERPRSIHECRFCHAVGYLRTHYADGCISCEKCGMVNDDVILENALCGYRSRSNYKRVHHWHERLSQYLLKESLIPAHDMQRIVEKINEQGICTLNKVTIRQVLRSLKMQKYIEKWLQIMHAITGCAPPMLSSHQVLHLDMLFLALQEPFKRAAPDSRRNFLNYNYVMHRLLDKMDLGFLKIFFPLIKSKSKLRALDRIYEKMCEELDWDYTPMQITPTFAIRLTLPVSHTRAPLQTKLKCVAAAAAAPQTAT